MLGKPSHGHALAKLEPGLVTHQRQKSQGFLSQMPSVGKVIL